MIKMMREAKAISKWSVGKPRIGGVIIKYANTYLVVLCLLHTGT
jgi:hypothetical protein